MTQQHILIVDFTINGMSGGITQKEALIAAGAARAPPIMMTTVAMVAGMIPAAVGFGANSGLRIPMAVTVIGGLMMSTIMSLIGCEQQSKPARLMGCTPKAGHQLSKVPKKAGAPGSERTKRQKAQIIGELRHQYVPSGLLRATDMFRSTWYSNMNTLETEGYIHYYNNQRISLKLKPEPDKVPDSDSESRAILTVQFYGVSRKAGCISNYIKNSINS